jgi:Flp pilus assembly protein TadB
MKNAIICGLTFGVVTFLVALLLSSLMGNVNWLFLAGLATGTALWNFFRELHHQKRIEKLLNK